MAHIDSAFEDELEEIDRRNWGLWILNGMLLVVMAGVITSLYLPQVWGMVQMDIPAPETRGMLVSGMCGITEHLQAGAYHGGWRLMLLALEFVRHALLDGGLHPFVAPAENANPPAFLLEPPCEHFNDGSLAGAADGEVANTDDRRAEMVVGLYAVSKQREPALHEGVEEPRQPIEHSAQQRRLQPAPASEDDVHAELFEPVEVFFSHAVEGRMQNAERRKGISEEFEGLHYLP